MNFKLSKIEKFLCLCLRHYDFLEKKEIINLYFDLGDKVIYKSSKLNNVASIVAHALITCIDSKKLPKHWYKEYENMNDKIFSYIEELNKVADLLNKKNIQIIALKNIGIAVGIYPYHGANPMGDIDVLVRKSQFKEAHQILTTSGYTLKFRSKFEKNNIESAILSGGAEYSFILNNKEHLWFELQWRAISGRWIQPKQEPNTNDLFYRSLKVKGSKVRLLSPEDNLLQVALHTAKHSYVRAPGFRLHVDVDRIVSTQNIDWKIFKKMVCKSRVKTAVYISLSMASNLLGTDIPKDVLSKIQPNIMKIKLLQYWLIKVGIFDPDGHKWSKFGYIIFVSLLFDSWRDFLSGIFPSTSIMKSKYEYSNGFLTPYYHLKRISDIILKRAKV